MANSGPNKNASQFFFTYAEQVGSLETFELSLLIFFHEEFLL